MGSAIPSIYADFTTGHSGTWTHYGMILTGILYFIESSLWTLDLWKKNN
jgi:cbb3-type cytochrome oxidase subunit 1